MDFKVGDWVFCEFNLSLIREMRDGRVTEVTDGMCSHSSYDLTDRCRPLTYRMKQVADSFRYEYERIHREGSNGLNFPDIHRWMVAHWVKTCDGIEDTEGTAANFTTLREFASEILERQASDSGYGFPLMRQRGRVTNEAANA